MNYAQYANFVQVNYYHELNKKGRATKKVEDKLWDWIEQYRRVLDSHKQEKEEN